MVSLSFLMLVLGCGSSEPPRVDAPVKASPAVDPKTGKANKKMEVSGVVK
jgi:hypothetical protein